MPLTHTRTFRTRYYECDAYGHLYNATYLRWMQETASDASVAGGFGAQRYAEMKRMWYIRQTEIEYLLPIFSNEVIDVTTWISDIRRASSRRAYEFRKPGSAELAARAHTDWVFLDTETGRPASLPADLATTFFPEGVPASFPPHKPIPPAPQPPPGAFTTRKLVEWRDIDMLKHVNNASYLDYVTECGFQVVAAHRWPVQRMIAEGFAILLRRNQIQYIQPAFLGDELQIATWISDVRFASALRHYHITRPSDNATIAWVHALGVWVDLATGRMVRIPKDMLADFASNLSQG